jgi:spermidine synthase
VDVGPGPIQDEWAPRIEFELAKARYGGSLNTSAVLGYLLERRPTPAEGALALGVPDERRESFERAYVSTELAQRSSWVAGSSGDAAQSQQLLLQAYELNPADRWTGTALADIMFSTLPIAVAQGTDEVAALEGMLRIRGDHVPSLRAMWLALRERGRDQDAARYLQRLREISPLDQTGANGLPGG